MTPTLVVRTAPTVAHYPPGATFGPRTLVDFEFVWLLGGSARWRSGPTEVGLRPGTLLLARPGMRDDFRWDPERASLHAYCHFRVEGAPGVLGDPTTWPLTRRLAPSDPTAALCRYVLWLGQDPSAVAAARTAEVLGWLLDLFVRGPVPVRESAADLPEHLARLADHVHSVWRVEGARAMSVAELARAAGVSPGHLSRLFRRTSSVGPVAALELCRLSRAAVLLQRSNMSVGAVAQACGNANAFHFSRRFRAAYGAPPRTYRATAAGDDPVAPLARAGLLPLARRLLVLEV